MIDKELFCNKIFKSVDSKCRSKKAFYYGMKGIKNYLTLKDIQFLFERDKAYLLNKPSIDRKDPSKDYTLDNCQFIEYIENCGKDLRLKQGQWSRNFDKCFLCGSNQNKHNAFGYCIKCYHKRNRPQSNLP